MPKNNIKIAPELENFLKKKRVYRKFKNNVLADTLVTTNCYNILCAFRWKYTPEGHVFWSNLSRKFNNLKIIMFKKIIKSFWFSSLKGSFGIVVVDSGHGRKAYLGRCVDGADEWQDEQNIADNGAPVSKEQVSELLNLLNNK